MVLISTTITTEKNSTTGERHHLAQIQIRPLKMSLVKCRRPPANATRRTNIKITAGALEPTARRNIAAVHSPELIIQQSGSVERRF